MNRIDIASQRSAPLDLLRTLAIALVFTSHYNIFAGDDWFKPVGQFGWVGVDLFFVLSGFLIASQLFKSVLATGRVSYADFYIRRGLRIWPNFFLVLSIYVLVPSFAERSVLPPLWKFITFTQNFDLDYRAEGAFSHAWSLCVEEQFYLILPFIILGLARWGSARRSAVLVGGIITSGAILRYLLWQKYASPFYHGGPTKGIGVPFFREIYYPTYCRTDGLLMGVVLAAIYRLRPAAWRKLIQHGNLFLLLGIAILGLAASIVIDEYSVTAATIGYPLMDLGFACLVVAGLSENGWLARVRWRGFEIGATLAFAFYLTHKPMIHLTQGWLVKFGISPASVWFPTSIFAVCLMAAIALYLLIERPCLLFRNELLERRQANADSVSVGATAAATRLKP